MLRSMGNPMGSTEPQNAGGADLSSSLRKIQDRNVPFLRASHDVVFVATAAVVKGLSFSTVTS